MDNPSGTANLQRLFLNAARDLVRHDDNDGRTTRGGNQTSHWRLGTARGVENTGCHSGTDRRLRRKLHGPDIPVHPNITPTGRFHIMRMMFGGRTTPYDIHYTGLDMQMFGTLLHEAGFRQIERVEKFGVFKDGSDLRFSETLISLNMIARKPF
jgi:hypothetical protein